MLERGLRREITLGGYTKTLQKSCTAEGIKSSYLLVALGNLGVSCGFLIW